jgi:peptidoglycan/LPS O-acetylase OafA/YrhL
MRPTLEGQFPEQRRLIGLFDHAGLGVSVFFVISGYLITRLLLKEAQETGTIDLRAFYTRRVFRILPVFYFYLLVVSMLVLWGQLRLGANDLINASFFVTNYKHLWTPVDGPDYWIIGHFWTLSLEEQFYLFWPVCFLLLSRVQARRTALTLICLMPVLRIATYFLAPGSRGQLNMMAHTGMDTIMAGCLVALWEDRGFPKLAARVLYSNWTLVVALLALFFPPNPFSGRYASAYGLTAGKLIEITAIVIVVMNAVRLAPTSVGRFLNSRPMVWIGTLSYSLYIWQQMFLNPFAANTHWLGKFPAVLIIIFIVAQCSHSLIEQPFIQLRRRMEKSKRPVRIPA